jgi:hypothetical protein
MISPRANNRPVRARRNGSNQGWTLIELMMSLAVGMLVLAALAATSVFCLRSFAGIYNYTDLDVSSRQALDTISKEVRQATTVLGVTNTASSSYIQFVNTNVSPAITNTYSWDSTDKTLTWDKTGQDTQTLLTSCDSFTNTLLQGWPSSNYVFSLPATTLLQVKIVQMKWKCSRTIFGLKMNSETEQAAEIVMRNK